EPDAAARPSRYALRGAIESSHRRNGSEHGEPEEEGNTWQVGGGNRVRLLGRGRRPLLQILESIRKLPRGRQREDIANLERLQIGAAEGRDRLFVVARLS